MKLYTFSNTDELHHYKKSLVIHFNGKRTILSTAAHKGGYHEDLEAVFNHDCNPDDGGDCNLKAPTYEEHMILLTKELGLNPNTAVGLMTAASMENVSIKTQTFNQLTVTAVVTGGIEINGGRVGDPASWVEENGAYAPVMAGTINIMLSIDAKLSQGALTRSLVTCTEAKTAAIQELLAPSNYSYGLATGSGTDGSIIISNEESTFKLTNAGKHSKLGELIGCVVKSAVKEALEKQTGICPKQQHNIFRRMSRFGVTREHLYKEHRNYELHLDNHAFSNQLSMIETEDKFVTYTSLYAHLIDQLMWGLLSPNEAVIAGNSLLDCLDDQLKLPNKADDNLTKEMAVQLMIQTYQTSILNIIINKTR